MTRRETAIFFAAILITLFTDNVVDSLVNEGQISWVFLVFALSTSLGLFVYLRSTNPTT